jgi:hypothetical protein
MSVLDRLDKMVKAGVPYETALDLARGFEEDLRAAALDMAQAIASGLARPSSNGAERTRRWREKKDAAQGVTVTSPDVTEDKEAVSLSPTPPNPSQEITTPFTPLKGGVSPAKRKTSAGEPLGFAAFWAAYPEKVGRLKAVESYRQAVARIDGPDPPGELLAAVERAKLSRQWLQGYVPNPATWLNQGRWMDQPNPAAEGPRHERPDKLTAKLENMASAQRGFALASARRPF